MLITILYVVEVISAILLIGVILLQQSKGGGLGGGFGAAMGESVFGTQANRALIKFTVWMSAIFVVTTLLIAQQTAPQGGAVNTGAPAPAPTSPANSIPSPVPNPGAGAAPAGSPSLTPPPAVDLGGAPVSAPAPAPTGDTPQN